MIVMIYADRSIKIMTEHENHDNPCSIIQHRTQIFMIVMIYADRWLKNYDWSWRSWSSVFYHTT